MSSHCSLLLDLPTLLTVTTVLLPTICFILLLHCLLFILPTCLHTSSYFVLLSPLHISGLTFQPCSLSAHSHFCYQPSASYSSCSISVSFSYFLLFVILLILCPPQLSPLHFWLDLPTLLTVTTYTTAAICFILASPLHTSYFFIEFLPSSS